MTTWSKQEVGENVKLWAGTVTHLKKLFFPKGKLRHLNIAARKALTFYRGYTPNLKR